MGIGVSSPISPLQGPKPHSSLRHGQIPAFLRAGSEVNGAITVRLY